MKNRGLNLYDISDSTTIEDLEQWSEDEIFFTSIQMALQLSQPLSEITSLGFREWIMCGLVSKRLIENQ